MAWMFRPAPRWIEAGAQGYLQNLCKSKSSFSGFALHPTVPASSIFEVTTMKPTWTLLVCSLALSLSVCAPAQNNDSSNDQNRPVLKTRPNDTNPPSQPNPSSQPPVASPNSTYGQNSTYGAPPNAIPEGTRFIIKLKDT